MMRRLEVFRCFESLSEMFGILFVLFTNGERYPQKRKDNPLNSEDRTSGFNAYTNGDLIRQSFFFDAAGDCRRLLSFLSLRFHSSRP